MKFTNKSLYINENAFIKNKFNRYKYCTYTTVNGNKKFGAHYVIPETEINIDLLRLMNLTLTNYYYAGPTTTGCK